MTRKNTLESSKQKKLIEEIIRVDHAGEYGAKRIYLGQLCVLKKHKEITHMLQQELAHLDYFEGEMKSRKVRPTILQPLWHIGGFCMGAITAAMGEKAAMACTVAVETVINEHYQEQLYKLEKLDGELHLAKSINKFREEEVEHMNHGLESGAEEAFGYECIKTIVSTITRVAIELSKKI